MADLQNQNSTGKRKLRFGLKILLLGMLLVSLASAWFANKLSEARFEANFIAQVETLNESHEASCQHWFDYQLDEDRGIPKLPEGEPSGPSWIRSIFGQHVFSRINSVSFSGVSYLKKVKLDDRSSFLLSNQRRNDPRELLQTLNVRGLKDLRILNLGQCDDLQDLSWIVNLKQLRTVRISNCENLQSLDGVAELPGLQKLVVSSGFQSKFIDIGALNDHPSLTFLGLDVDESFSSVENWSTIASLSELKHLCLDSKKRFRDVLNRFSIKKDKRKIHLSNGFSMQDPVALALDKWPDENPLLELDHSKEFDATDRSPKNPLAGTFRPVPTLQTLRLRDVDPGLKNLSCFREMPKLDRLELSGAHSLQSLEGLQHCHDLKHLQIERCSRLSCLKGLRNNSSIRDLNLTGSESLKSLDDLSGMSQLTHVVIDQCTQLEDIDALLDLPNLIRLDWNECPSLETEDVEKLLKKFPELYIQPDVLDRDTGDIGDR